MERTLRYGRIYLALLLLPTLTWAEQQPLEQQSDWMAMLLNGSKTGYMRLDRSVFEDRVVNRESLVIQLNRGESALVIQMEDETVETPAGKALSFSSRQLISGGEMTIKGEIDESGLVTVTSDSAGSVQQQSFQWQPGSSMTEGLRLLTIRHGLEPGTRFSAKAFIPSSLQTYEVEVLVGEIEIVDLFGVESHLHRVEQTMMVGQVATQSIAWMDSDYNVKKLTMDVMGMTMEIISCPRECAISDAEPTEFFTASFANSPRRLEREDLNGAIRYRIAATNPEMTLSFPESLEQTVRYLEEESVFELTVQTFREPPQASPVEIDEQYLAQTRWLQTEATEIQQLAQRHDSPAGFCSRLRI
jgi:hypothetical protein